MLFISRSNLSINTLVGINADLECFETSGTCTTVRRTDIPRTLVPGGVLKYPISTTPHQTLHESQILHTAPEMLLTSTSLFTVVSEYTRTLFKYLYILPNGLV
jgi:hypothetical protein